MVPNLVGQHLSSERLQFQILNLPEANNNRVIDQSDHREAAREFLAAFFVPREAPSRLMQLDETAPLSQGTWPGSRPCALQFAQLARTVQQAHLSPPT